MELAKKRKTGEITKWQYIEMSKDFPQDTMIHLKWIDSPGDDYLEKQRERDDMCPFPSEGIYSKNYANAFSMETQ